MEMSVGYESMWLWGVALVAVFLLAVTGLRVLVKIWWLPRKMQREMGAQGIKGPPYRLISGNLGEILQLMKAANAGPPLEMRTHDILARVLPEIYCWSAIYGKNFLYWFGPIARLVVPQPELIREVLCNKSGAFEKPEPPVQLRQLTGDGLANSRGDKWAKQRRLIGVAFHAEALKAMVPAVVASTQTVLDKWDRAEGESEIEVLEELRKLTADLIARTAFGSSYEEGKHIFDLQTQQAVLAAESFTKLCIPGYRFLPTPLNLKGKRLERQIHRALEKIIHKRTLNLLREQKGECSDLLGIMISACSRCDSEPEKGRMTFQEMVDECKTFFVAGHETTSLLLTWTLILLAMHTHWQNLARNEVSELCNPPDADTLSRLKIVNMVLQEALRLYPPLPYMVRRSVKRAELGKLSIPAGTELLVPVAAVHHDCDLWGRDAHEFNPQRFLQGVSKAVNCSGNAFMPFGLGPRTCMGMNFSLMQAKIVICMILQRFSFTLSPAYVHSPSQNFTIRPAHGAPLRFTALARSQNEKQI